MHIFETPFYYIDYVLASTVAMGFLVASRKDYDAALQKYIEFQKRAELNDLGQSVQRTRKLIDHSEKEILKNLKKKLEFKKLK